MSLSEEVIIKRRKRVYYGLFILLFIAYLLMRRNQWQGSTELHTIMEVIATILAFIVGILALLRFYTKKNNTFLFIGSGFIGTGLLDGYHAIVTSTFFNHYFPSVPSHLIPWSWIASRLFLSVLMFVSWWAWKREERLGEKGIFSERLVFSVVSALTLISFLFFAFVPLPRAYYPELFFGRPEEFVPALFFLLALIGYLRKGWWKNNAFEHWLVLSLIVGFMGQAMFMSFSYHLFDFEFDAAHLLKKVSYICVLTGLLINFYYLFRKSEKQKTELIQEIAERKLAEQSMRKYRTQNELLLNSAGEGVIGIDTEGKHTFVNPAAAAILGYEAEELIGKPSHNIWHHSRADGSPYPEDDCPIHKSIINISDETRSEDIFWHKDGQAVTVSYIATLIRQNGGVLGAVIVFQDIGERKKIEAALKESKERFEDIARSSSDWIWETDAQGNYTYVSGKIKELLGFEVEEVVGKTPFDLMDEEEARRVGKIFGEIAGANKAIVNMENWNVSKDGKKLCLLTNGVPLLNANGELLGYRGTDKDITERKQAEEALRENETKMRNLFNAMQDIVFEMDYNGTYLNIAPTSPQLMVKPAEEMTGKTLHDAFPKPQADQFLQFIQKCIDENKAEKIIYPVNFDGKTTWFEGRANPIENKRVLYIASDITDRKQAEEQLKRSNESLERSNKDLQDFAYIASHDLQEPLRKVLAFGDRLKNKFGIELGEQGIDYLNRMNSAATRMRSLIDDLLTYSRVTTNAKPFGPVELNTVIKNILSDLEVRITESGAQIEIGDLPVIEADKMQIHQLFQNLISNALKFNNSDLPPKVKISAFKETAGDENFSNSYHCIEVQDNGIGFDEKYVKKIFSPFQRLHGRNEYEGSGIGLTICKKIVERHGGRISAKSEPGKGSVFLVQLPVK